MFKVKNRSGVFIVKLWTYFTTCSSVSVVKFEQVNAGFFTDVILWIDSISMEYLLNPKEVRKLNLRKYESNF